ncbi:hypothetical protein [Maridesulfovibrio sp. FT414]|uniref:hypothetical protein n=1 Tax=Maridesulfovibrio sp. FT414 TaxID=2979469 RepID=UPI003D80146E
MNEMSLNAFLQALQKEYTCAGNLVARQSSLSSTTPSNKNGHSCLTRNIDDLLSAAAFQADTQLRISKFALTLRGYIDETYSGPFLTLEQSQQSGLGKRKTVTIEVCFDQHESGTGGIWVEGRMVLPIPDRTILNSTAGIRQQKTGILTRLLDWITGRKGLRLALTKEQAKQFRLSTDRE